MAAAPLSFKARALRHLARREHTRAELERKLAARLFADATAGEDGDDQLAEARAAIARALDDLAASGLLSDERAAESLVASQRHRFGARRLKQALLAKGLAPELVAASLEPTRETEHVRAVEVWRRRFGGPAVDAADRARQMRFLAARGFDADVIRKVVKGETED